MPHHLVSSLARLVRLGGTKPSTNASGGTHHEGDPELMFDP